MIRSIFLILCFNSLLFSQYIAKKGGIGFRTDDNQPIERYTEYDELFQSYNQKFTFAINLGKDQITSEYVDMLELLQSHGQEMMDHTPWHNTYWFSTILPTDFYQNHPGVQNISGNNIELKHVKVDQEYANNFSKREGYVNIDGNIVTSTSGIFTNFSKEDCYLYFPSLDKLVFIDDRNGWIDANNVEVEDFWRKEINLGVHSDVKFYNFDCDNIHLTIDAIKAMAQETQRLAVHFGLEKPKTWIQPGGYFPKIYRNELKQACEDLGYKAAGVFTDPGLKVFNEYNPLDDKQFGMNYGDFRDDIWTLEECKEVIADRVAKHHVLFGLSHFTWMELLGGWDGFMERTEGLLQWCVNNDIPIKTYTEWADILYTQTPDPFENIIPKLNVDLDENGIPDGYESDIDASLDKLDGAITPSNYCYSINKVGEICSIKDLGGVEKGENNFSLWLKGTPGSEVTVKVSYGTIEHNYLFQIIDANWSLFNLDQSINGNTTLNIPENVSLINVRVNCTNYSSGSVKVSEMSLMKAGYPINIKIHLEGAYNSSNIMFTNINNQIPHNQPYSSGPWNYAGTECCSSEVPNNIVDWVLISLMDEMENDSIIYKRAALLSNDGNLVDVDGTSQLKIKVPSGHYYIKVEHRNHLSVLSADKIYLGP